MTAAAAGAWADPAGRHGPAAASRAVLSQARARFAEVLSCREQEVWFAPNAETALVTALHSVAAAAPGLPVVASAVERLALLQAADALGGADLLAVDATGMVDPADPALRRPAAALLVQAANREIGTRQPLDAVAAARSTGTALIVDASAVRSPTELPASWDVVVLDPAMWGGPDGVAVMGCRTGVPWAAQPPATAAHRFIGRGSTMLAAVAAMSLPTAQQLADEAALSDLVEASARRLAGLVPHAVRLGHPQQRLGYLLAVSMLYVNADQLVDDLARRGFAVHSGSACSSETRRPSHVLTAIGALTSGNLRISLPPGCPADQVDALVDAIAELVRRQRAEAGLA